MDLVADGASAQIDVNVSRLTGGSVTVNIAATDGLTCAELSDVNEFRGGSS